MAVFVILAGLPGTGKSTLAAALAERLGGVVLSKDVLRAAMFPGGLVDYSPEQDDVCFRAVLAAAGCLAGRQLAEWIFLDGRTFSRSEQIEEAVCAAETARCRWKILHVICPAPVAEARIERDWERHPAANRTVAMYREVRARFVPIALPHIEIDTSEPMEDCVRKCLEYLAADKG